MGDFLLILPVVSLSHLSGLMDQKIGRPTDMRRTMLVWICFSFIGVYDVRVSFQRS